MTVWVILDLIKLMLHFGTHTTGLICNEILNWHTFQDVSTVNIINQEQLNLQAPCIHQESPISSCLTLQHLAESTSVAQGALVASVTNLPQVQNLLASPDLLHLREPFKVFKAANVSKGVQVVQDSQHIQGCQGHQGSQVVQDSQSVQGCQGQSR